MREARIINSSVVSSSVRYAAGSTIGACDRHDQASGGRRLCQSVISSKACATLKTVASAPAGA
jgi:hypothetical protein